MRPRIFRNFGTKVLSIGLAALLWGVVAGQREAERSLRVPLEYRNIPPELELLGEPASLVDVRVRGSSGVLGELRGADLVAVLDLRSARPGRRLFHLLPGDIAVPAGVKVLQATPSTLSLTFEASAVRTVPVVPDLDGEPAPGFIVGRVTTEPATVEVDRPRLRRPEDHRSDDRAGGYHRRHQFRSRHSDHRAARHDRAPARPAKRHGDG